MDHYNQETRVIDGVTIYVRWYYDNDNGAPWEENDGHGPVREVSRPYYGRPQKKSGERFLNRDPNDSRKILYAYDWQEACRLARKDGWNTAPHDAPYPVARAVQADFDYLRGWLEDEWWYCGIGVSLTRDDDDDDFYSHALWCVESNCADHHEEVIKDLAGELLADAQRWVYPVNEIGV